MLWETQVFFMFFDWNGNISTDANALSNVSSYMLMVEGLFELSNSKAKYTNRCYVITIIIIIIDHTAQSFHGNDKRKQYRTALRKVI